MGNRNEWIEKRDELIDRYKVVFHRLLNRAYKEKWSNEKIEKTVEVVVKVMFKKENKVFKSFCERTLGTMPKEEYNRISEKNIKYYTERVLTYFRKYL